MLEDHFSELAEPLPDGGLLFLAMMGGQLPVGGEMTRPDQGYLIWRGPDEAVDTLAWHGGIEQMRVNVSGGQPSGEIVTALLGRSGQWFVDWHGGRAILGDASAPEIEVHGLDGSLRLVRWEPRNLTVDLADAEAARQARIEWIESRISPPRQTVQLRAQQAVPEPTEYPPYLGFLADTEGNLWVQEYPRPTADSAVWLVFDPDGRELGTVTLPKDLRIFEIGGDYLLTLFRDDLDVEHVRLYPLTKPRPTD